MSLSLALGCGGAGKSAHYTIYKNNRPVLEVSEGSGTLTSKGFLEPGQKPVTHPFLSASSLDASEEHNLRLILDKAKSFGAFMTLLQEEGYRAVPRK